MDSSFRDRSHDLAGVAPFRIRIEAAGEANPKYGAATLGTNQEPTRLVAISFLKLRLVCPTSGLARGLPFRIPA